MIYGCGCLVMVGVIAFLIWAAVVLSNPYSAALVFIASAALTAHNIWINRKKRRHVPSSR